MQNRQGAVNNKLGNVEVKELIYTNHGHELRLGGECRREGVYRAEGTKRGKMGQL